MDPMDRDDWLFLARLVAAITAIRRNLKEHRPRRR